MARPTVQLVFKVEIFVKCAAASLPGRNLRGRIAEADNFVDSDAEQFRSDRRGTEMAGVIAAVANNREGIVGVAPQARGAIQNHDAAAARL